MPFAVQRLDAPTVRKGTGGGFSPLVRRDECGKEIVRPDLGRIAWNADEYATYVSPIFLHESCLDARRGSTEARPSVDPLGNFLASLETFLTGQSAHGESTTPRRESERPWV